MNLHGGWECGGIDTGFPLALFQFGVVDSLFAANRHHESHNSILNCFMSNLFYIGSPIGDMDPLTLETHESPSIPVRSRTDSTSTIKAVTKNHAASDYVDLPQTVSEVLRPKSVTSALQRTKSMLHIPAALPAPQCKLPPPPQPTPPSSALFSERRPPPPFLVIATVGQKESSSGLNLKLEMAFAKNNVDKEAPINKDKFDHDCKDVLPMNPEAAIFYWSGTLIFTSYASKPARASVLNIKSLKIMCHTIDIYGEVISLAPEMTRRVVTVIPYIRNDPIVHSHGDRAVACVHLANFHPTLGNQVSTPKERNSSSTDTPSVRELDVCVHIPKSLFEYSDTRCFRIIASAEVDVSSDETAESIFLYAERIFGVHKLDPFGKN